MSKRLTRTVGAVVSLTFIACAAKAQTNLTAKANQLVSATETAKTESDRVRDGLNGPVRRVRTEVVKLSNMSGQAQEGKRTVLETAEYDVNGTKTQNQYYPVTGAALTGREVYKYDDKGNISEMTLLNTDGSLLSREVYKYEFDSMGNWTKMTTSIALVANGTIEYEPSEVTYRTIFYYLDASVAKTLTSSNAPASAAVDVKAKTDSNDRVAASLPPLSSLEKLNTSPVQLQLANLVSSTKTSDKSIVAMNSSEPPPSPPAKPVSGGVLNGKALSLPAPKYPEVAMRMHLAGKVEVEVVVDENGKVISAHAVSGPGQLREVAVDAANRARFSPTKLSGQPVKISGKIEYNFVLP